MDSDTIPPFDAWCLRRQIVGETVNGELEDVSPAFSRLAARLNELPPESRRTALDGFLCGRADDEAIIRALANADPDVRPAIAEAVAAVRCATLVDLRRVVAETRWTWQGWIAAAILNALASDPGVGKTIFAMWMTRLLWTGGDFPDGQPNNLPAGTKALWVPGDRQFGQILDLAGKFEVPDEALLLNAPPEDPAGGLDLDDEAEMAALRDRVEAERPGLVIVDTVGMTTGLNLCRPEDARQYFAPLMDMAVATETTFLMLTHLNKDGQALGRRINGACRVVLKMTHPDPDQADRRRLWVEKSLAEKPPALGMTIATAGCSFDFNPPSAPEPDKGGRPSEGRDKAKAFIRDALARENDQIGNKICAEWEKKDGARNTFWRAADDLEAEGVLVIDGKPKVLHLIQDGPDTGPDF
jgi:hypothetical protein